MMSILSNIYWIGGSPCSGKSTIAQTLAEKYGWRYYSCDDAFWRHNQVTTPEAQPTFYRVMRLSSEDVWVSRPVAQQVAEEIAIYREEFPMILADLLALPRTQPILAEGAALLPECVAPLLTKSGHAVWVTPTADFQLAHYAQRAWAKDVVKDCSDPALAFDNWMQRDIQFAQFVRDEAQARGFPSLVVDGKLSLAENTAIVEKYLLLTTTHCPLPTENDPH